MNPHIKCQPISSIQYIVLSVLLLCLWINAGCRHAADARVNPLIVELKHADADTRAAAVAQLGEIGSAAKAAVPTLIDLLRNDESGEVRDSVAEVLWKIGGEAIPDRLEQIDLLKHQDATVRTRAAFNLGCHRPHKLLLYFEPFQLQVKDTRLALAAAVKDNDEIVRWMAVVGVMRLAGKNASEVVPVLAGALKDENISTQEHAATALARIGASAKDAVPALIEVLKRPKDGNARDSIENWNKYAVEVTARIALRNIGAASVPPLIDLLREQDDEINKRAVSVLGDIGSPAIPALLGAAQDGDSRVRKNAVEALGRTFIEDKAVVAALVEALKDERVEVRREAASSMWWLKLGSVSAKAAVPPLIYALKDADTEVRFYSVRALKEIGSHAGSAVPALMKMLNDEKEDKWTRTQVVAALINIAPEKRAEIQKDLLEEAEHDEKRSKEMYDMTEKMMPTLKINPMYR